MARAMGLGRVGDPDIVFGRKNRFTFSVYGSCFGRIPEHFVRTASLPNITFEETEINFMNEKMFIPGKATFETLSVTYLKVATAENSTLFQWLVSVYNFTNPSRTQGSKTSDYSGTGYLTTYDGCGQPLDQYQFGNMWPSTINFGDVDYASSDTIDIELTLRYSNLSYVSYCPFRSNFDGCCTPCGS